MNDSTLRNRLSHPPVRPRMFDFDALNRLIGTPEMLKRGKHYAGLEQGSNRKSERR